MKLIFAGTPPFAAAALIALHQANHEIVLVLTREDRKSGRGMRLTQSATADVAEQLGIKIEKPKTLNDTAIQEIIRNAQADAMVVAAYGLLLPKEVLDTPLLGCLNIHGSLLPRWRGAAPVQRAIEAGDVESGITIMKMDAGLDTGPVLFKSTLPISPDETSATLFAKLTALGATTIVTALEEISVLLPVAQSASGVTYAQKIGKSEARINWSESATLLERRVRAFDPFPGAESSIAGENLKIWRASVHDNYSMLPVPLPGTVIATDQDSIHVQCGQGVLALKLVQKAGGKRIAAGDFLRNNRIQPGLIFS
jgi:methionyl-tRNA formyltransferase